MDRKVLVGDTVNEAQRLLEQLARSGLEITAALWAKESENGEWNLYIVAPLVDTKSLREALFHLHTALQALPELLWLDSSQIQLIGPSSPVGRDILALFNGPYGPKGAPRRWHGTRLGNIEIDGAYLYPLPVAAS